MGQSDQENGDFKKENYFGNTANTLVNFEGIIIGGLSVVILQDRGGQPAIFDTYLSQHRQISITIKQ